MAQPIHDAVERFTVAPASDSLDARDAWSVVLVLPGADRDRGFALARTLLLEGARVRLVAHAVTLPHHWPDWVRSEPGLRLTELGAYQPDSPEEESQEIRHDLERWLDETFREVIPGIPGHLVFFASTAGRIAQPALELAPLFRNVLAAHGRSPIYCLDREPGAVDQLRALADEAGAPLHFPDESRTPTGWVLPLLGVGLPMVVGAAAYQARAFFASTASRRRIRRLQREHRGASPPVWVAVAANWPRINRHVMEGVAEPLLRRGVRPGFLLFGSLAEGERVEADLRRRTGRMLWPTLQPVLDALDEPVVEQVTGPATVRELAAVLGRATLRSARVLARLLRAGPRVRSGGLALDLRRHRVAVAKLATQDVFSATAAEAAATAVTGRHRFAGSTVVFSSAAYAPEATADLLLQRAGAHTIEFMHGSIGGIWFGASQSRSSSRCVWTHADAKKAAVATRGQRIIVASPLADTGATRPAAPRRFGGRVLLLTNYVHRDSAVGDVLPLLPFQTELLRVVPLLRAASPAPLQFRWRPHPSDNEQAVLDSAAPVPELEISRSESLLDDVEWADVTISSLSSAAVDALLADLPVFLHVPPAHRSAPEVLCFDPQRRFFIADELVAPFTRLVRALAAGDPHATEPERRTREALFGSGGRPSRFDEHLRAS